MFTVMVRISGIDVWGISPLHGRAACRYHRELVSLNSTGRVHLLLLQTLVEMEEVDRMAVNIVRHYHYIAKKMNSQRIPS